MVHVEDLGCEPLLVHVEDLSCEPLLVHVEDLNFHYSKHRFRETMPMAFSIVDFPLLRFVLKPVWSEDHVLHELLRIRVRSHYLSTSI